ncbi:MAG: PQQ-dependent dehydrogenase, methanol/ethanol family, partial [Pseudomonadota bacterium]
MRSLLLSSACAALVLSACSKTPEPVTVAPLAPPRAAVNEARLLAARDEANAGQWMSHGNDYSEQRFSTLKKVNTDNVAQLGLAWFADFDTRRGQESTPIVVDGVLYVTTA